MGILQSARSAVASIVRWAVGDELFDSEYQKRKREHEARNDLVRGDHKRMLTVKSGHPDDNLTQNFIGLIVNRQVSALMGGGVEFELPYAVEPTYVDGQKVEQESPQEIILSDTWNTNKQEVLLHRLAWFGAVYGTPYVKLVPEGIESADNPGLLVTRLVAVNPRWVSIDTDSEDMERITGYQVRFGYTTEINGRAVDVQRLETISREMAMQAQEETAEDGKTYTVDRPVETGNWVVREFKADITTGGKWQQMGEDVQWPYQFPPMLHWQNLPDPESPYGINDIDCASELQDRYNFVSANLSKIIRFHASPMRWSRGVATSNSVEVGPDRMINVTGQDAGIFNLEMASDLSSSRAFALDLRQAMFDLTQTVDLTSITDKLGSLTNFGLRVLYKDSLDKLGVKRELYGDALVELNHRLLVLAGFDGEAALGGHVVWPDPLPMDNEALASSHIALVSSGIESKETAQVALELDPDTERERFSTETQQGTNIGAELLRAFSQGK